MERASPTTAKPTKVPSPPLNPDCCTHLTQRTCWGNLTEEKYEASVWKDRDCCSQMRKLRFKYKAYNCWQVAELRLDTRQPVSESTCLTTTKYCPLLKYQMQFLNEKWKNNTKQTCQSWKKDYIEQGTMTLTIKKLIKFKNQGRNSKSTGGKKMWACKTQKSHGVGGTREKLENSVGDRRVIEWE